jgi:hypothetical protein
VLASDSPKYLISLDLPSPKSSQNIQPTHLKIDADGTEFEVLMGTKEILES